MHTTLLLLHAPAVGFHRQKNKRMCSPASFEQAPSNRISWQKSKCASQHQPTSITKHLDFKIFKVLSKKHSGHTLSSFFSGPLKYPRLCTATGSWNATCRNLAGLLWPTCIVLHTYTILYIYIYINAVCTCVCQMQLYTLLIYIYIYIKMTVCTCVCQMQLYTFLIYIYILYIYICVT